MAVGGWRRRALIRGDAVAIGVLSVVSGVMLIVAAEMGHAVRVSQEVFGTGLVTVGGTLIYNSRKAWRTLLTEVAAPHVGDDPGPSPVPWIADDLWRARNRFDPELDPALLLIAEIDPLVKAYGADATGAFPSVTLRPVTPEERALAAPSEVPPGAAIPEPGDAATLKARLEATPGRFVAVDPRWPICCGRPATFETDRPEARAADAVHLPADPASVDDPLVGGSHGFQCRACGRRYATDPAF